MKDHFLKISGLICSSDFCIAGGAIADYIYSKENDIEYKPDDFDLFFINHDSYTEVTNQLRLSSALFDSIKVLKERKNSTLFQVGNIKIDIIYQNKNSYLEIIQDFDLLHCCHYYDYENNRIESLSQDAYDCATERHLALNNTKKNPYITLRRVSKFIKREYSIDQSEELAILDMCYNYEEVQTESDNKKDGGY